MDFYVYAYIDTNKPGTYQYYSHTFSHQPVYIGKGKEGRMNDHIKKARRLVESDEPTKSLFLRKLVSMLRAGNEPVVQVVAPNLSETEAFALEVNLIKSAGRVNDGGVLYNVAEGGTGGITWTGENPFKGKSLEELHGKETAERMRAQLSESAKKRTGANNPNYRDGKSVKRTTEPMSGQESRVLALEAKRNAPDEAKQEWYAKISAANKGRVFSDEHKAKIKATHHKSKHKGTGVLALSDETKQKLSAAMKGREFSAEHRSKLTKCIRYEEWKLVVPKLLSRGLVTTITSYRVYAKSNPDLKLPTRPEKSYAKEGWAGFAGIFY